MEFAISSQTRSQALKTDRSVVLGELLLSTTISKDRENKLNNNNNNNNNNNIFIFFRHSTRRLHGYLSTSFAVPLLLRNINN